MRSIRPHLALLALTCSFVAGCAGFVNPGGPMTPGENWFGARRQDTTTVVVTPVRTAPEPLTPAAAKELACREEAARHRLDIEGDEGLSIGMAYRRCMSGVMGAPDLTPATAVDAAPGANRPSPYPEKPFRN